MATVLHTESSSGHGGQEIRTLAEVRWLLGHGWGALIACQPDSPLFAEAKASAIPVEPVRMRSATDVGALLRLRRLIRDRDVSLVHTHSSIDSWVAGVAAKSLGRPVVRTRHVSIPIGRRRALVYRLADRIITSAESVRSIVIAAGIAPERVMTIAAGVEGDRFHPGVSGRSVRRELGLGDAPVVGLVANVRGSKGHNVFLEAAGASGLPAMRAPWPTRSWRSSASPRARARWPAPARRRSGSATRSTRRWRGPPGSTAGCSGYRNILIF